jgi:hypothetical protein
VVVGVEMSIKRTKAVAKRARPVFKPRIIHPIEGQKCPKTHKVPTPPQCVRCGSVGKVIYLRYGSVEIECLFPTPNGKESKSSMCPVYVVRPDKCRGQCTVVCHCGSLPYHVTQGCTECMSCLETKVYGNRIYY